MLDADASAAALRRRALREGDGDAALELGRRAWAHRGRLDEARRWVRVGLRLGAEDAPFYETWLATTGPRRARVDPAMTAGFAEALGRTGDVGRSRAAFRRAALRGDPVAQACYARVLLECDLWKASRRWFRRAAPEVPWAAAALAENRWLLPVGRTEANVARDLRRARVWYRHAATLGDTRAKARLKALGTIRRR